MQRGQTSRLRITRFSCGWPPASKRPEHDPKSGNRFSDKSCVKKQATIHFNRGWPPISKRLGYSLTRRASSMCCGWPSISKRPV